MEFGDESAWTFSGLSKEPRVSGLGLGGWVKMEGRCATRPLRKKGKDIDGVCTR